MSRILHLVLELSVDNCLSSYKNVRSWAFGLHDEENLRFKVLLTMLKVSYGNRVCPYCGGTGDIQYGTFIVCSRCKGRGKVIDVGAGLGSDGMVSAYREVACPDCSGSGIKVI